MQISKVLAQCTTLLPAHFISAITYRLTRMRTPLLRHIIQWFVAKNKIDLSEAELENPNDYQTFNAFFTRALKPEARPIAHRPGLMVSPVDGTISQVGRMTDGKIIQAKGQMYSLSELIADKGELYTSFRDGAFATIYLSPRDYHRIHMPCDGQLKSTAYVPGRLLSVAPRVVNHVPGVFSKNERLVAHFHSQYGPFIMVLVGAINVSAISTRWAGDINSSGGQILRSTYSENQVKFNPGDEMAKFNLGSTVILITPSSTNWSTDLKPWKTLKMGEVIAELQ